MTTAVLFDLDGTLVHYDRSYRDLVRATCRDRGVDPGGGLPAYYVERWFEHLPRFDGDPYVAAAADVGEEYDADLDPGAFAATYVEKELAALSVPDAVRRTLADLDGAYPLGVLTNGVGPVQRRKLAEHDLDGFFETVLTATDLAALKPDPAAFEAARDRLPADSHVYVGDNVHYDVEPASDLGFGTALVGGADADGPVPADVHVAEPSAFGRVRSLLD